MLPRDAFVHSVVLPCQNRQKLEDSGNCLQVNLTLDVGESCLIMGTLAAWGCTSAILQSFSLYRLATG